MNNINDENTDSLHLVGEEESSFQEKGRKRSKRRWTVAQKMAMLDEAEQSGVAQVARKYKLASNQLFTWRKQKVNEPQITEQPVATSKEGIDMREQCEAQLVRNEKLQRIQDMISEKLTSELKAKKITAYCAAGSFSSLVSASAKICQSNSETLEQLRCLQANESERVLEEWECPSIEIQRAAERELYYLIKKQLEADKERKRRSELGLPEDVVLDEQ